MPAGYVRVWLSMEEAIDHVTRVAECSPHEARGALTLALCEESIRSRFGDNGQEIKHSHWLYAAEWAPRTSPNGRQVKIQGEAAWLRSFFDPPPDREVLPERPRQIEIRREDLMRLWPTPRASQDADGRVLQQQRRKWRREWIARFAKRQRTGRRWIAFIDLINWCAESTTAASNDEEIKAREVAYRRLTESVQRGELERDGRSKVLYLDTLVTSDGASPRCRLTREQFEIAVDIAAARPAPSLPITMLDCCWLPADLARQWLQAHGYRLLPYLERLQTAGEFIENADASKWSPTPELRSAIRNAISALGRPPGKPRWEVFCDRVAVGG